MRVIRDMMLPARDGTLLAADIFLPDGAGSNPALVTLSPYQKDVPWHVPEGHTAKHHEHQAWETPDPLQWTAESYAVVRVDARGSGKSGGVHSVFSHHEATDYYDAIEWVARQPWCTGAVGATGISYYAMSQWRVAALSPPSLKAFVPWSGSADVSREFVYRGGIMAHDFFVQWYSRLTADHFHGAAGHKPAAYGEENAIRLFAQHDIDGPFWETRRPDVAKIDIPFLSASSWHSWKGPGHVRGNLEMFKFSPAKDKRLRISTGNYFLEYYSDEVFAEQLAWFDYWLKGISTPAFEQPRVRLQLQSSRRETIWRHEDDWPIPGTRTLALSLAEPEEGKYTLSPEPVRAGRVSYPAPGELPLHAEPILGTMNNDAGVTFFSEAFEHDTDLAGEAALIIWGSSTADDMELHVFLDLLSVSGETMELTRGWLKASHRELDTKRSTERRPFHAHIRKLPMIPGKAVKLSVELWPFAVRMHPGDRLKLRIAGSGPGFLSGWHRRPRGMHTIQFGGEMNSTLLLPVAPK